MITLSSGRLAHICVRLPLLLIFISSGCNSPSGETEQEDRFLVAHPLVQDTIVVSEYVADIHAVQNIELRAKAGGYLEAVLIDEGQLVQSGQVLFRISNQFYQHEQAKAEATLNSILAEIRAAEVSLRNTRNLVEKNIVSATELELAEANLLSLQSKAEEAKAHLASAQLELTLSQVRAPFTGYVNRIPNKIGSLIDEGTLLTTISNNNEVYAYFNVSEKEYLDFAETQLGGGMQEISLLLANNQVYPFKGFVETTESEIDRNTGTIAFRAKFPNPKHLLKHGSSGKVRVGKPLKQVMLIPQKSTFEIQENIYVYQVNADRSVSMKRIVPSIRLPHFYVVSEGLSADDLFIVEGIQRVKQGDRIEMENVSSKSLAFIN
ncbi:MAG: efflux RND transporter periplasmic adaptor subunit [Bacteroidota bacterium]